MGNRYTVIPRTLCFIFHGDEVLLIKGSNEKDWSGIYNVLGGHIEKGEEIINSANREIQEESGLSPTDTKLKGIIHACDFFGKNVMIFVTVSTVKAKEIKQDSREGILEWRNIHELESINIFQDIKPIINQIMSMKEGDIFLAFSQFDGKGRLLSFGIKTN